MASATPPTLGQLFEHVVRQKSPESELRTHLVRFLSERVSTLWIVDSDAGDSDRVMEYFQSVVQFCEISGECIVHGLFLLAYYRHLFGKVDPIRKSNLKPYLLVSLLCASKFNDDGCWANSHFAKYGGTSVRDLKQLEVTFLRRINFQLFVPTKQLDDFFCRLLRSKECQPMAPLVHIPYENAVQLFTVENFHEVCLRKYPRVYQHLSKRHVAKVRADQHVLRPFFVK